MTSRLDPNGLYRLKSIVRVKGGGTPLIDVSPARGGRRSHGTLSLPRSEWPHDFLERD